MADIFFLALFLSNCLIAIFKMATIRKNVVSMLRKYWVGRLWMSACWECSWAGDSGHVVSTTCQLISLITAYLPIISVLVFTFIDSTSTNITLLSNLWTFWLNHHCLRTLHCLGTLQKCYLSVSVTWSNKTGTLNTSLLDSVWPDQMGK